MVLLLQCVAFPHSYSDVIDLLVQKKKKGKKIMSSPQSRSKTRVTNNKNIQKNCLLKIARDRKMMHEVFRVYSTSVSFFSVCKLEQPQTKKKKFQQSFCCFFCTNESNKKRERERGTEAAHTDCLEHPKIFLKRSFFVVCFSNHT